MQPLELLTEVGQKTKISFGFGKLSFDQLSPTSLFSDVLAARSQEVTQAKDSQPAGSLSSYREEATDPVESIREEVAKVYERPEEVVLPPERKQAVLDLLGKVGLEPKEAEKVVAQATDQQGNISLGSVLSSIKKHRLEESRNGEQGLEPGLVSKILVLAEKMGVSQEKLEALAQKLGSGSISLQSLVQALQEAGPATKTLTGEDLAGVKEILVKAGLSPEKAEKLILNKLDAEGGLSLKGLTALVQDAAEQTDKAAGLVRSGRLTEIVKGLLEGSGTKPDQSQEAGFDVTDMSNRLKRLEADQKLAAKSQTKTGQRQSLYQTAAAKAGVEAKAGAEAKVGESVLKELEALILKPNKDSKTESVAAAKAESKTSAKVQPESAGINTVAPEAAAAKAETRSSSSLAAKTATVRRVDSADSATTRATSPQAGQDRVDLSAAKAVQTGRTQSAVQTARAGQARMNPSLMLEQLSGRMTMMLKNGQSTMRLHLNPPELGGIRIELKVDGSSVRATIVAENQQVQQMLGSNSSELRQSLSEQGFNLDKFEVLSQSQFQQAGSDQGDSGQGRGQTGRTLSGDVGEGLTLSEELVASQVRMMRSGLVDLVA